MFWQTWFNRCEYCDTPRWRHWRDHDFESQHDEPYEWDISWEELTFSEDGSWQRLDPAETGCKSSPGVREAGNLTAQHHAS